MVEEGRREHRGPGLLRENESSDSSLGREGEPWPWGVQAGAREPPVRATARGVRHDKGAPARGEKTLTDTSLS